MLLSRAGITAAVVFALTFFLKVPSINGYVHLGDAAVYLASVILPPPYAAIASAMGAGLADLCGGYALYLPFTVVIKAVITLTFTSGGRVLSKRNILALAAAIVTNAAGYYLCGALICGNFIAPLSEILGNLAQGVCGAAVFFAAGAFLDANGHLRDAVRSKNKGD